MPQSESRSPGRAFSVGNRFGVLLLTIGLACCGNQSATSSDAAKAVSPAIDVDPDRNAKDRIAELAKQAVPSALKDPSSADFGDVQGVSASIACGTVNGKNSFGAMTGQTRFIFDGTKVAFENGEEEFAHRWNTVCIARPLKPAPSGVGPMRFGSKPSSALKQYAPTTDDGLTIYIPKLKPATLEGIPVAESDYSFDHGHLYSGEMYLDGAEARNSILSIYLKRYGPPQFYNEELGIYRWKWPNVKTQIIVSYNAKQSRTTVTFGKD